MDVASTSITRLKVELSKSERSIVIKKGKVREGGGEGWDAMIFVLSY
jgi:hypothetical protein